MSLKFIKAKDSLFLAIQVITALAVVWQLGRGLYESGHNFIPKATAAAIEWGNDVITVVTEHEWKYTDAVLYGGIFVILVYRYSRFFKTPEQTL